MITAIDAHDIYVSLSHTRTMKKLYITVLVLTLGFVSGITLAHTVFGYDRGWYTLGDRQHCSQGDQNCFCNNPNACDIQFTTDPRTNNQILLDMIHSQGNGHFIPDNLQDLFDSLTNAQQTGDFSNAFHQCLELKHIRGLDFSCRALITQGAADINPGQSVTTNNPNVIIVPGNQSGPILQVPQVPQQQENNHEYDNNKY